jgi:TPR repeat protein
MLRASLSAVLALVLCAAATAPAVAGWDEARAALKAGKTAVAFHELKPMAEDGDKEAQYMIAYLLSTGSGTKQDYQEAYKWYTIAVARGHASANSARSLVRKKLNFAAAAEAERAARTWLQEYQVREAEEKAEERRQEILEKQQAKKAAAKESKETAPAPDTD